MRGAPHQRILQRHSSNQRARIPREWRSPDAVATFPRPEQAKSSAMPADDRLWLHEDEGGSPAAPSPEKPRPEPSVGVRYPDSSRSGPFEHLQLVAKRKDLEVQRDT